MKSEPEVYSISQLEKDGKSLWEGVRNFQARNFMMKDMSVGDVVLFYHSSTDPAGIFGVAKVCSPAKPDPSQFEKKSEYFEPRANKEKPVWYCVEVEFVEKLPKPVLLAQIRQEKALKDLLLLKRGQRLSIQPVQAAHAKLLLSMGQASSKVLRLL